MITSQWWISVLIPKSLFFKHTLHCGYLFPCLDHCDWASCFEWCLSKPNFCTQLWATVRYWSFFLLLFFSGFFSSVFSFPFPFCLSLFFPFSFVYLPSLFTLSTLYSRLLPFFSYTFYPQISNYFIFSSFSPLSSLFPPSISPISHLRSPLFFPLSALCFNSYFPLARMLSFLQSLFPLFQSVQYKKPW